MFNPIPTIMKISRSPCNTRAVVDHAVEYVRGNVHTDRMETSGVSLSSSLQKTYTTVEPSTSSGTWMSNHSATTVAG